MIPVCFWKKNLESKTLQEDGKGVITRELELELDLSISELELDLSMSELELVFRAVEDLVSPDCV